MADIRLGGKLCTGKIALTVRSQKAAKGKTSCFKGISIGKVRAWAWGMWGAHG